MDVREAREEILKKVELKIENNKRACIKKIDGCKRSKRGLQEPCKVAIHRIPLRTKA